MDAADDRLAPVRQRADEVEAPQRPPVVEALRHERRGRLPHPGLVGPLGALHPADVRGEVERLLGDPARLGVELDAVAPPRARGKPRVDRRPQLLEVERLGGGLEHDQLQGVAADRLGLEREDACVVDAEAIVHTLTLPPDHTPGPVMRTMPRGVLTNTCQLWKPTKASRSRRIRRV